MNIVRPIELVSMSDRAFGKMRKDLADLLRPRSKELENLSMSFTDRTKGIEIVSFFEEEVMLPFKTEVSKLFLHLYAHVLKYCFGIKANKNDYCISDCTTQKC
jgi:hypothetical protein